MSAGNRNSLRPAGSIASSLESLAVGVYRWFTNGKPLAEPIDLYPVPAVAGPDERRAVLEALLEAASGTRDPADLKGRGIEQFCTSSSATVPDLRLSTGFPDSMLRSALDGLGKKHLVRVEVHTLSRRFSLRPVHELRVYITELGCSYLANVNNLRTAFGGDWPRTNGSAKEDWSW